jgi:hypothetical protein
MVALGVALAGGGTSVTALLILGLLMLVVLRSQLAEMLDVRAAWARLLEERWTALVTLSLSVVVVATVGLTYRAGLGALAGSWLDWLLGFAATAQSGRSIFLIPVFLLVYEPLVLVFGLIGAVRSFLKGDSAGQVLAGAALIGLMFVLFYSGREAADVIWLVVPLAALAAKAIVEIVAIHAAREEWPLAAALAGILVALLGFASLNVIRYAEQARFQAPLERVGLGTVLAGAPNLLLAGLAIGVAGLVTYLFAAGWSARAALTGASLTGAGALLAMTLGAGWGLAQLRPTDPVELWWARPTSDDVRRLVSTLTDVSNFSVGQENEIEVTVQADPDGALAWALRDFSKAAYVDELGAFIDSPVVIAPEAAQNPALGSAYVGQDFPLLRLWFPDSLFANEQLNWLVTRRAPVQSERVILWVRQDIQQLRTVQQP